MDRFAKSLVRVPQLRLLAKWLPYLQILGGAGLLACAAQLRVPLPFTPVPVSLQTFTVFVLGMTLGARKAPLAVLLYLGAASCGASVLASGANSLWLFGPTGGYLVGFLLAAALTGYLADRRARVTFVSSCLIAAVGEAVILGSGFVGMAILFGAHKAFLAGVLPFLLPALYKIGAAASVVQGGARLRSSIT